MSEHQINITYQSYTCAAELPDEAAELLKKAAQALEKAHAPYSKFKVGAAVLLANGQIFTGNNQENAAYPSGLCAERVALFAAKSQFPTEDIKIIFITSTGKSAVSAIAPCGGCRQTFIEYQSMQNTDIKVFFQGTNDSYIALNSVKDLVPFSFDHSLLK